MAGIAADIRKLVEGLDALPETLTERDHKRETTIDEVKTKFYSDISAVRDDLKIAELAALIKEGHEIASQMSALTVAMKNAVPILAKLGQQADNDQAVLAEILKRAGHADAGFDASHAIIRAQHDAARAVRQKFEYAAADLKNLGDALGRNSAARQKSELMKLYNELHAKSDKIGESLSLLTHAMAQLEERSF